MNAPRSHEDAPQRVDTYMDMVPNVTKYLDFKYAEVVTDGLDNIVNGPAMYVANHLAFDDSLAIAAVYANHTGKPLRLGAKAEYFKGLGVNNRGLFGKPIQKFVEDTQQIPIYREDDARGGVQLGKDMKHRFAIGESVLFHAEGTRSVDGRMNKFKKGAAFFAIKNHVPAVPVSVTYGRTPFHFRKYAEVQFGTPFNPPLYGLEFPHHAFVPDGLVNAVAPHLMSLSQRADILTEQLEVGVSGLSGQERSGYFLDPYTKKLIIPAESEQ